MTVAFRGLAGFRVRRRRETDRRHYLRLEPAADAFLCPTCGSSRLAARGAALECFFDLPAGGKGVLLQLSANYRCKDCGWRGKLPLPGIDAGHGMTERLLAYIRAEGLHRPVAEITREVGVPPRKIREIMAGSAGAAVPGSRRSRPHCRICCLTLSAAEAEEDGGLCRLCPACRAAGIEHTGGESAAKAEIRRG